MRLGKRGFNLLELVIGLMIFSTVSIALLGVWSSYYQMMGKSRSLLVATNLAQHIMEQQIALGWQSMDVPAGPGTILTMEQAVEGEITRVDYQYSVEVTDNSAPGSIGLKQVVVFVSWKDSSGRREVRAETMLYWGS